MNEKAMFKLSYGLYIIATEFEGKRAGCVANTLQQITASPIQVSITLNKDNYTEQLIEKSGKFNAVVLSEQVSMDTIGTFGFHSSKDMDKFADIAFAQDILNIPYIKEHTSAVVTCNVVQKLDVGSHVLFVGEVVDAEVLSEENVMTYAYYHQVKNGATPKNASSYQEEKEKHGWRCSICGYIYEGETLPEDYICPLCSAPASAFEKI